MAAANLPSSAALLAICLVLFHAAQRRDTAERRESGGAASAGSGDAPLEKGGAWALVFSDRYFVLIGVLVIVANFVNSNGEFLLRQAKRQAGHLTASALVVNADRDRVLLTLHPKVGRWLQLGGHCEAGDRTLRDAAGREAREESGIAAVDVSPAPIAVDRHAVPCAGGMSEHLDVQYLAVVPNEAREAIELAVEEDPAIEGAAARKILAEAEDIDDRKRHRAVRLHGGDHDAAGEVFAAIGRQQFELAVEIFAHKRQG